MSAFSEEWLSLREPADAAARDVSITQRLTELLQTRGPSQLPARSSIRFFDLGCGTGANFRYLAPRVRSVQEWMLLDSDERLLAAARERAEHSQVGAIGTLRVDLARHLEELVLGHGAVVTASALLDLVSPEWLTRLLDLCASSHAIVLFALSYDGRIELTPSLPDDAWIRDLVNHHQRTDKGFGPALGPAATTFARQRLAALQYQARVASSDWLLDAASSRLQADLLKGWANAALEIAPEAEHRCARWLDARLDYLNRGQSFMRVGHQDLIGWPSR